MVNLITEHIDIWTAAQTQKGNGGRGRGNNGNGQSPHGIKKLRELILELAVRGKLVPQDPKSEPASVLLDKIGKEKARLLKEGKIKKQKGLPEIGEHEKLFDLPLGWEWARLGNIFDIQDYLRIPVSIAEREQREGTYPYYGANGQVGVIDDYIFEGERVLLAEDGGFFYDPIRGVAYIANGRFWVNNHVHVLECLGGTCAKFWVSFFNRMDWGPLVRGMTRAKLNQAFMIQIPLALPPLEEQHRIVAKVDELMALCDQLEQKQTDSNATHKTLVETLLATLTNAADQRECAEAWQRISGHFDVLFTTEQSIDQLKQTILQLAVMGKLVPQNPSDESAASLLEKIAKEKARLNKEGKIKKQKPLPEITDDEKPFELPYGWKLVRFAEISQEISTGPFGSMIHRRDYLEGGIPLINPSHMFDCSIVEEESVAVSMEEAEKLSSYRLEKGDIVMARRGELGRCALVTAREDGWLCGTGSFRLKFHIDICRAYILLLFKTEGVRNYLGAKSVGTTMTNLNHSILKMMPISLPPAAEQHRIVNKVHELMALCDTLKCQLNDVQTTQVQLADVIAEQAVA